MGCTTGKLPYETRGLAQAACDGMSKRRYRGLHGERVRVMPYLCPRCGMWHVGHDPQRLNKGKRGK